MTKCFHPVYFAKWKHLDAVKLLSVSITNPVAARKHL